MEKRMRSGRSIMMWCGMVLLAVGLGAGQAAGG